MLKTLVNTKYGAFSKFSLFRIILNLEVFREALEVILGDIWEPWAPFQELWRVPGGLSKSDGFLRSGRGGPRALSIDHSFASQRVLGLGEGGHYLKENTLLATWPQTPQPDSPPRGPADINKTTYIYIYIYIYIYNI